MTASVDAGNTIVMGEFSLTTFSETFQPVHQTGGLEACNNPNAGCPGWGFANYNPSDATTWRAGVEQKISVSGGSLHFRGGFAFEQAYTLGRSAGDPFRNGGSAPAPPFLSDFEPPRENALWFSGGVGYVWNQYEVAMGIARADSRTRWLTDFRIHFP